ncbi:MAG: sulfatase-like hydrolase/transferase, partial [Planctomycetaceae bacterium]|nr:sulfatase-like hydrolase/transferase [Planctomycetaceae bacterium]
MGELENTLVIVTSDNGMPFPRAKANCYEYGIHMPLAICWPSQMPGGRTVDDLIGFVDLTATILDAAQVSFPADAPGLSGRSIVPLLNSEKSGICEPQ